MSVDKKIVLANSSGYVGIGTSSPTQSLEVAGNALVSKLFVSGVNNAYDFYNAGTTYLNGNADVGGNMTVAGNFTVNGTTTTVNTNTLDVKDINITVAKGATGAFSVNGAGLTIDGVNVTMAYSSMNDRMVFNRAIESNGLQLALHSGASGGIGFGTGISLYSSDPSTLAINGSLSVGTLNASSLGLTSPLAISAGGTNAITQSGAANNILPAQTSNAGKYLTTDGSNVSWNDIGARSNKSLKAGVVFTGTTGATVGLNVSGLADFTYTALFTPYVIGSKMAIWGSGSTNAVTMYISAAGKVVISNNTSDVLVGNTTLVVNKTYHVVYVRKSGVGTIYIDNVVDATGADTTNYSAQTNQFGQTLSSNFFNGVIYSSPVYTRALSVTEVASLYDTGLPASWDYYAGNGYSTGTYTNSGYTTFTGATTSAFAAAGTGNCEADGAVTSIDLWSYQTMVISFTLTLNSGQLPYVGIRLFGTSWLTGDGTTTGQIQAVNGVNRIYVVVKSGIPFTTRYQTNTAGIAFATTAATDYSVSGISFSRVGVQCIPDPAQLIGGTTWYDTASGPGAINITLPNTGVFWRTFNNPYASYLKNTGADSTVIATNNNSTFLTVNNYANNTFNGIIGGGGATRQANINSFLNTTLGFGINGDILLTRDALNVWAQKTPNITVTGASGTGSTVTLTLTGQITAFPVGSTIVVANINPMVYNGTYVVTASSTNSVSFASTANSAYVSGGTIYSSQIYRTYNTWTDASNYERISSGWVGNVAQIFTEKAGTGTARNLSLGTNGTAALTIDTQQNLSYATTWNSNITVTGASGTGSIATLTFSSTSVEIPIGSTIVVTGMNPSGYNGTFTVTASTLTSVSYSSSQTGTFVSGGTIQQLFTAIKANITDTASYVSSILLDLQVGGVSKFNVNKTGQVSLYKELFFSGNANVYSDLPIQYYGIKMTSSPSAKITFTSDPYNYGITPDAGLKRNSAGIIEINNGTAGTFRDLTLRSLLPAAGTVTVDAPALSGTATWNGNTVSVTGASGDATTATITFATQTAAYPVGSTIVVAGINPSGYNGTYIVTASTTTSVSYANSTVTTYVSGGTVQQLFNGIKLNVTDTASNASSKLIDLQVGGTSKFVVDKAGYTVVSGTFALGSYSGNKGTMTWNGSRFYIPALKVSGQLWVDSFFSFGDPDGIADGAQLNYESGYVFAQRRGTNAQTYRLYNTYTSATNYERLGLTWATNVAKIYTEAGSGGGTARSLEIGTNATTAITIDTSQIVTLTNALAITSGGTGATTASGARNNLGLVIGTDVLAPSGSGASLTGITATQVGLGNVTNDTQTKATIVPNTIPSAGQLLVGNAGGTAYAPVSSSGDVTVSSAGAFTIGSLKVTNAMLAGSIDLTTKVTGTLPITNGGTGATTQSGAANNILPSQSTNNGKFLTTDGSNVSWGTVTAPTWGNISGTLSSQTDLQSALDAKANLSGATFTGAILSTLGTIAVDTPNFSGTATWNASTVSVTGASGTGSTATLTFATQTAAYPVGSTIVVAGINPNGYNGTFIVTASTTTSVSYASTQSGTYNSGGTIQQLFTGIRTNITDTASASGSYLMDLQVNGTSKVKLVKDGTATFGSFAWTFPSGNTQFTTGNGFILNSRTTINAVTMDSPIYCVVYGTGTFAGSGESNAINLNMTDSGSGVRSFFRGQVSSSTRFRIDATGGIIQTIPTRTVDQPLIDSSITWNGTTVSVTGASGTGTTATLTFATQTAAYPVGSTVVVAGMNPSGYNGTYVVTASSTTSVSYASAQTGTFVSGGTVQQSFTAIKANITDTASSTSSLLMDLQVGGTSKFKVDKTGKVSLTSQLYLNGANIAFGDMTASFVYYNGSTIGLNDKTGTNHIGVYPSRVSVTGSDFFGFVDNILNTAASSTDAGWFRDSGAIIAQRNGTNAQTYRLYNTYTSSTNYERLGLNWATNVAQIYTEAAGTGTARSLVLGTNGTTAITIDTLQNVGIGTSSPAYKLEVNGSFAATSKSFVIDHPTKEGKKLQHGVVEGPEHSVYIRGRLSSTGMIYLPEYWAKLVDSKTITVQLTPIGNHQRLSVVFADSYRVMVQTESDTPIDCYYYVQAERKDIEKLEVEI